MQRDSLTPRATLASVRGKLPLLAHGSAKNPSGRGAALPSWWAEPREEQEVVSKLLPKQSNENWKPPLSNCKVREKWELWNTQSQLEHKMVFSLKKIQEPPTQMQSQPSTCSCTRTCRYPVFSSSKSESCKENVFNLHCQIYCYK